MRAPAGGRGRAWRWGVSPAAGNYVRTRTHTPAPRLKRSNRSTWAALVQLVHEGTHGLAAFPHRHGIAADIAPKGYYDTSRNSILVTAKSRVVVYAGINVLASLVTEDVITNGVWNACVQLGLVDPVDE